MTDQTSAGETCPACAKKDAALRELADLMDDVVRGKYWPDSFTTQPARNALAPAAQGELTPIPLPAWVGKDTPELRAKLSEFVRAVSAPAPSAGETDEEDVKTELRFWLGWAHRRLSPIHASYIPARFLLAAAPTTGEL